MKKQRILWLLTYKEVKNMKWTTEETAFMYLHLNKTAKEIYAKYTKKFGKKRTFKSVEVKASSLRKKSAKGGTPLGTNTRAVGKKAKPSPKPKKKTSKKKISNKKECRTCGVELTDDNRYPSMKKKGVRQCKKCWNAYLKERKKLKKVLSAKTEKTSAKKTKTEKKLSYSDLEKLLKQKKESIVSLRKEVSKLKSQQRQLTTTLTLSEESWKLAFEKYTKKMEGLLAEAKKKPLTRRERRKLKKQQKLQAKLNKLVGENNDTV
jgi:hypothetical protein